MYCIMTIQNWFLRFMFVFTHLYGFVSSNSICLCYFQVKSVRLATLNRARFGVVVQSFLETGMDLFWYFVWLSQSWNEVDKWLGRWFWIICLIWSETSFEDHVTLDLSGQIPSVEDANRRESVLTLPWQEKPLELGIVLLLHLNFFVWYVWKVQGWKINILYLCHGLLCSSLYWGPESWDTSFVCNDIHR
jgi:hypothetical protein